MVKSAILVVDDDLDILNDLSKILDDFRSDDNEVLIASSVKDAKKLIDEYEVQFLITDLQMPEQNGVELLRFLLGRPTEERPDGILVLSGFVGNDLIFQSELNIATLAKPFKPNEIIEILEFVISKPLPEFKIDEELVEDFKAELRSSNEKMKETSEKFLNDPENDELIADYKQVLFGVTGTCGMFGFEDLANYLKIIDKICEISIEKCILKPRKKLGSIMVETCRFLEAINNDLNSPNALEKHRHKMRLDGVRLSRFLDEMKRRG